MASASDHIYAVQSNNDSKGQFCESFGLLVETRFTLAL